MRAARSPGRVTSRPATSPSTATSRRASTTPSSPGPQPGSAGYYYQSEVHNGDNIVGGERCEIIKSGLGIANAVDEWYAWSLALPSSYPLSNAGAGGTLLGQFHSNSSQALMGQANIQFATAPNFAGVNYGHTYADPGLIVGVNGGPNQSGQYFATNGQTNGASGHPYTSYAFDLGKLSLYKGVGWIDWLLHLVWSDDGAGTFELYRRFPGGSAALVAQLFNCSNIYRGYSAYLKLGQNRKQSSGLATGYAWFDEAKQGDSFAAVDPA